MVPQRAQADVYYVLKSGEIRGPFNLDDLKSAITKGELSDRDLVQSDGVPIWQPLGRFFAAPEEEKQENIAMPLLEWRSISEVAWTRLRHDLEERSLVSGALCLGVGVLTMVLSRLPIVFWLPWFAAASVAAVALLRRQRAEQALALLAGVVCLPFLFFVVAPSVSKRPESISPLEGNMVAERTPASPVAPLPAVGPVVTAVPVNEEEVPVEQPAMAAATEPLTIPPVAQPAEPQTLEVAASPQPTVTGAAAARKPLPASPPDIMTDPLPTPTPATATAAPEGTGLLKRTVDFFSTLGSKPAEQPPVPPAVEPPQVSQPDSAIESVGDFVQRHTDAFVVIQGRDGSGSGFICRVGSQTYLFTNIHVIAGMQQAQFTRLDGSRVVPGGAHAAAGHDVLRFAVSDSKGNPLEAMTDFANNVRIGDKVVVLGNSGGGGVVTNLPGTIVGIGPDRIEVSAEFIPGNSGSPIVHVKTGKVIGVATYLTKRYEEFASAQAGNTAPVQQNPPSATPNTPPSAESPAHPKTPEQGAIVVRRFAYRLDSVRTWEPVNWTIFQQESEQIRQISLLTEDVIGFLRALRTRREPSFATETLRRPATQWLANVGQRVSSADRLRATESFLRALRSMVRSDVTSADARLRYSYFRDELKNEREVRDRLFDAFDVEAKRLASPSERFNR